MFRNPRRSCEDLYNFMNWFIKMILFFIKQINESYNSYNAYAFHKEPIIEKAWCDLDENNIIHEKRTRSLIHGYCFYDEEDEEDEETSIEEDKISLKLSEDLGQDPVQDPVQDLGQDPVQDPVQDLGQDPVQDLGQDLGQDPVQDLGQETINEINEEPSAEPSIEPVIDSDEDIYKSAKTV